MHVPELVGHPRAIGRADPVAGERRRRSACSPATSRFAKEFDRGQGELAALLAAHAAASLDAAIALDRERRSAHTDALTGLLNRRGLEERLDRELDAAQDDRRPLSLSCSTATTSRT